MRRTWLAAIVFVGCATQAPSQKQASAPPAKEPLAATSPAVAVAAAAPPAPAAPPTASGVISRRELDAVLSQSPGYFLQHVDTRPHFRNGHFLGWRLVAFFPGDARFAGVDLQAGDVVTRINGRPIEQPDQFMTVWTALRSANELAVDVERDGTPRTLRWQIVPN